LTVKNIVHDSTLLWFLSLVDDFNVNDKYCRMERELHVGQSWMSAPCSERSNTDALRGKNAPSTARTYTIQNKNGYIKIQKLYYMMIMFMF